MQLQAKRRIYSDRPFQTEGVSLYLAADTTDPGASAIVYRNLRFDNARSMRAFRTDKTNRVAFEASPAETMDVDLSAYVGKDIRLQLRTCLDDVECEVSQGTQLLTLDGSGDDVTGVAGSLVLLETELRAGGDVRIRTRYTPSTAGVQPTSFTASRTAGPTTPANVTVSYSGGDVYLDFDFTGLSSASAYTFKIFATASAVNYDMLTGISVTADNAGPAAPSASLLVS